MTSLGSHDAGMHDARPDGEGDQAAMLRGIACRQDQKNTQDGINPANHLQIIPALPGMPLPTRGPNQTEWIDQKEDHPKDHKGDFKKPLACGIVHAEPPSLGRYVRRIDQPAGLQPQTWANAGQITNDNLSAKP